MTENAIAAALHDLVRTQSRSMNEHFLRELPPQKAHDHIAALKRVTRDFDCASPAKDMVQNADFATGALMPRRRSGLDEGPRL